MRVLADGVAFGHRGDHRRRKSFGCGLVKRMRSMPSTASQARRSSPKSVFTSGRRSRPHELTFWPSSVISRTPSGCQPRDFGEDLARPAAHLPTAHRGDDAVRADRVAAHRDLHPGLEAALAVHGQRPGELALLAGPEAPRATPRRLPEPVRRGAGSSRARRRRRRTGRDRRSARAAPRRSSRRRRSPSPGLRASAPSPCQGARRTAGRVSLGSCRC